MTGGFHLGLQFDRNNLAGNIRYQVVAKLKGNLVSSEVMLITGSSIKIYCLHCKSIYKTKAVL